MLGVVGVCASLLIYFLAIRADSPAAEALTGEPIQLTDVLDNKFYARGNNATWISDTELLYRDLFVSMRLTFFHMYIHSQCHFVSE